MNAPPRLFLTIKEAKEQLRIGHTRIYQLMNSGKIEKVKLGRKTLIPCESVDSYVASLRSASS